MLGKLFGGSRSIDTDSLIDSNWSSFGGIFNSILSILSGLPLIGDFFKSLLDDNQGDTKAVAKSLASTFLENSGEPDADGNENTSPLEENTVMNLKTVASALTGEFKDKVGELITQIKEGQQDLGETFARQVQQAPAQCDCEASKLRLAVESAFENGNNAEIIIADIAALATQAKTIRPNDNAAPPSPPSAGGPSATS